MEPPPNTVLFCMQAGLGGSDQAEEMLRLAVRDDKGNVIGGAHDQVRRDSGALLYNAAVHVPSSLFFVPAASQNNGSKPKGQPN